MRFTPLDWSLIILVFAAVVGVAFFIRGYSRSVSDFLAGNRSAGRYLLTMSGGIVSVGLVTSVGNFEKFYQAGFAASWWGTMLAPIGLVAALSGWVGYRYRQTRALTMAQFFEMRYSRRLRVFAGVLAWVSGVLNYGIFPGIVARFIVNFTGLPQNFEFLGCSLPTILPVMAVILGLALLLCLTGGMVTVMVTDFVQAQFINVVFACILVYLLFRFSWGEVGETLLSAPPGRSMVNPFDQGKLPDFNVWFFLIFAFKAFYNALGWQGTQGYNAAAKSPHEGRMAAILGGWRNSVSYLMVMFLPICAYVFLHHPAEAAHAEQVRAAIALVGDPVLERQVTVPVTIAHILPAGLAGLLCAAMIASAIGTDTTYLHSWGSIFIQDVVLPFRKKPLSQTAQIRLLRWSITAVAVFALGFSLWFPMRDYVVMYMLVTGAVYMAGSGAAIVGGLYWSRGTTAGAWASLITGATLALLGAFLRTFWESFPALSELAPAFPLNGAWIAFLSSLCSLAAYVTVSLLTCREPHDMDALLHRRDTPTAPAADPRAPGRLARALGVNAEFTRGDRAIYFGNIAWTLFWFAAFVAGSTWALFSPIPDAVWLGWWRFTVLLSALLGFVTVVWFLWGGMRDLRELLAKLGGAEIDPHDNGSVRAETPTSPPSSAARAASSSPAEPCLRT